MSKNQFSDINIEIFLTMTGELPYDVYVQLSPGRYTKIFKKNDKIDPKRFRSYAEKGTSSLYILKKDRRDYINTTEKFVKAILSQPSIKATDATRAIEELTEQTLFEIYEDHIFDEETLKRSTNIAKAQVNLMKHEMKMLTQFLQLCKNETYMIKHSISTSVLALLLAKASGNNNDRMFQIVALGALLHDIGMTKLSIDYTEVDRALTPEEWMEVKRHPIFGVNLAENVPALPSEVLQIIEQHHENYDGSGYPRQLKGDEIYYPARIVTIADSFAAMTTKRAGRALYTPREAFDIMKTEKGKYDQRLFDAFDHLLHPNKKSAA